MLSLNGVEINITNLKNNKIKFSLPIKANDGLASPFEIILKEEKNKNELLLNQSNEKKDKENIDKEESQKENNSSFMDEELQYI